MRFIHKLYLKKYLSVVIFKKKTISNSNYFLFKFSYKTMQHSTIGLNIKFLIAGLSFLSLNSNKELIILFFCDNVFFLKKNGSGKFLTMSQNKNLLNKYYFGAIIGYNIYKDLYFFSLCKRIKLISIGGVEPGNPSHLLDYVLPIAAMSSSKYLYNLIITACLTFKISV